MKSQTASLFQNLMETDGLEAVEQERLDGLVRYIRESLEGTTSTIQASHSMPPGELSHLSASLRSVLELCTMYLVALDEQFTPQEQDWVDAQFGPDTAEQFIKKMPAMNWESCFGDIYEKLMWLDPGDQSYMNHHAAPLFQNLMESDGLEEIEQDRLDDLMRYIRETLANAKPA
jgi:hypothetical protein